MNTTTPSRLALVAATAAVAISLVGCAPAEPEADTSVTASAESVILVDGWVKTAESGMTAAFGELVNPGDTDVTLLSVASPIAASVQLHETVESDTGDMVMQQKQGGIVISAGGSHLLAPGSDHLMLMDLNAPIVAGDDVSFTLSFDDGSTLEVTVPAKDFSGANETYDAGQGGMDMGDGGEM